jgi:peptidoglycan hydrolase-like protein with peptidoglycan-binding domain
MNIKCAEQISFEAAPARGHGFGRELMKRAELYAVERGCTDAFLDTFSFQARPFYEKLGHRVFGMLGPIDGVLGPESRSAIRSFQARNGLPVTVPHRWRFVQGLTKLSANQGQVKVGCRSPLERWK